MLYEYGIRGTYLQGITDKSMLTHEYVSSSSHLTFCVPFHPKKHKIRGLNVSCLYKLYKPVHGKRWRLFIKISNITKGVTWLYNPFVYCKPEVDEDVTWLSYWPIGNIIDPGDAVNVRIFRENGMMVHGCGASLAYIDDGKVEQEARRENETIEMEEVIGGDLSAFEVSTGVYYLCRHDFSNRRTPGMIKSLVGDFRGLQGWRKYNQLWNPNGSCMTLDYVLDLHRDTIFKAIGLTYFNKKRDISDLKTAIYGLEGVDFVWAAESWSRTNKKNMYVLGSVDSMAVLTCVREFDKTVIINSIDYNIPRYMKLYYTKIRRRILRLVQPFFGRDCYTNCG